jgi:hypothetical protein
MDLSHLFALAFFVMPLPLTIHLLLAACRLPFPCCCPASSYCLLPPPGCHAPLLPPVVAAPGCRKPRPLTAPHHLAAARLGTSPQRPAPFCGSTPSHAQRRTELENFGRHRFWVDWKDRSQEERRPEIRVDFQFAVARGGVCSRWLSAAADAWDEGKANGILSSRFLSGWI